MMKKLLLIALCAMCCLGMKAQRAELYFPHFAGKQFDWYRFEGNRNDTLVSGTIAADGRLSLSLPDSLHHYRGLTRWLLRSGGGLDLIFSGGENFTVSCTEAQPSDENIIYSGSLENTYLSARFGRQQHILGKIDAMRMATEVYKDDSSLLPIFSAELSKQEQAYNRLQQQTVLDTLYAARLSEVVNVTMGLPPVFSGDNEESGKQYHSFVVNDLDMEALYTSGHWSGVLEQFLSWYTQNEKNRPLLVPDVISLLNRIRSEQAYTALAEKVVTACEKLNWHDQELELAFYLMNDDRIGEPSGRIANLYTLLKVRKGAKAPALVNGKLPAKKTILAFYDSGCGNCTTQMMELARLYPQLRKQGYEVVSVSADSDKGLFLAYASQLPWVDKYCDQQGFAGKDFVNYGIIGTPTFYILDAKGIVQGRYAQVEDMGLTKGKQ